MRKVVTLTGALLFGVAAALGCSAGDEPNDVLAAPETAAPSRDVREAAGLVDTLLAFEALATELESRAQRGALGESWHSAWGAFMAARRQPDVAALIETLRASSLEAAAQLGESSAEPYFEAFRPVFVELEAQRDARTLDPRLGELQARVLALLDGATAGEEHATVEKARNFCCRVHHPRTTTLLDPLCIDFRTVGIVAGAKCVAFAVAAIADGSTLTGGTCAQFTECSIAVPPPPSPF